MSFWFKNGGHKLYKNPLQRENKMDMAWLEYSTGQMDEDLLAREISSDFGLEVVLSCNNIYLLKKGPMEEKLKLKSLHVEINLIRHQQNFTIF